MRPIYDAPQTSTFPRSKSGVSVGKARRGKTLSGDARKVQHRAHVAAFVMGNGSEISRDNTTSSDIEDERVAVTPERSKAWDVAFRAHLPSSFHNRNGQGEGS